MIDQPPTNSDNLIVDAIRLIDPEGSLEPESRQYDVIVEMIEGWIRQHGPAKALDMARNNAKHLDAWRKFL